MLHSAEKWIHCSKETMATLRNKSNEWKIWSRNSKIWNKIPSGDKPGQYGTVVRFRGPVCIFHQGVMLWVSLCIVYIQNICPFLYSSWKIGVRSLARAKDFSSSLCVQTGSEAHPASCTMGTGGPFAGEKRGRGVTLTTHPHLVPWSRMSRSYTSSPPKRHHGV
jgi:hypothetical protein